MAIVRFVPRANGAVVLGACTPLLGDGRQPDCLLLNHLPFFEDMRSFTFASFASRPEAQPSPAQLSATDDLIDSMQLVQGETAPCFQSCNFRSHTSAGDMKWQLRSPQTSPQMLLGQALTQAWVNETAFFRLGDFFRGVCWVAAGSWVRTGACLFLLHQTSLPVVEFSVNGFLCAACMQQVQALLPSGACADYGAWHSFISCLISGDLIMPCQMLLKH